VRWQVGRWGGVVVIRRALLPGGDAATRQRPSHPPRYDVRGPLCVLALLFGGFLPSPTMGAVPRTLSTDFPPIPGGRPDAKA
jgi:hypothetical protein